MSKLQQKSKSLSLLQLADSDDATEHLMRNRDAFVPRELRKALQHIAVSSKHSMVVASCHAALAQLGFNLTSKVITTSPISCCFPSDRYCFYEVNLVVKVLVGIKDCLRKQCCMFSTESKNANIFTQGMSSHMALGRFF